MTGIWASRAAEWRQVTDFNLIDDPWIKVVSLHNRLETTSIRGLLKNAGEYRQLNGEAPSQNVAVFRLLLSVVYDLVGNCNVDDWAWLWGEGKFTGVDEWCDANKDLFWLTGGHGDLFYQETEMEPAENWPPVSKLITRPVGDIMFSDRKLEAATGLDYDEAARWLVTSMGYDVCGVHTPFKGDYTAKVGKHYTKRANLQQWTQYVVEEADLFKTIMLNVVPLDAESMANAGSDSYGQPSWRTGSLGLDDVSKDKLYRPNSIQDCLTWRGRRIMLHDDGSKIDGVLVCQGKTIDLTDGFDYEPMAAWKLIEDKKEGDHLHPLKVDSSGFYWRALPSLLSTADDAGSAMNVRWAAEAATTQEILPEDYLIKTRLLNVDYGPQDAIVSDELESTFDIPSALQKNPQDVVDALSAIRVVDEAAVYYGSYVWGCRLAMDADAGKNNANAKPVRAAARRELQAAMEPLYPQWLLGLANGEDGLSGWRKSCAKETLALATACAESLPDSAVIGALKGKTYHSSAISMSVLRARLRRLEANK